MLSPAYLAILYASHILTGVISALTKLETMKNTPALLPVAPMPSTRGVETNLHPGYAVG